ncbi:unnamed protein product [Penicillium olsonii]|nr:unnamed protein product [Penicillium olsonii]
MLLSYVTFVAAFASGIFSTAIDPVSSDFGISKETSTLGVTLFVVGFASGPVLWAPTSEQIGREWPIKIGMLGYSIFSTATATAKDVQTLMICRFFAGLCSASPVAIVPACFADIFDRQYRVTAITAFAMAVFAGPFMSQVVGGFIIMNPDLGWRWTMYVSAIMGWAGTILLFCFQDESYAPVLLVQKAKIIRQKTGNWAIHAKHQEHDLNLRGLVVQILGRPFRMLFTEPIVLLVTLYMSFVYGLMYALLGAYPVIFQGVHKMNAGHGGLPFLSLVVGEIIGGIFTLAEQQAEQRPSNVTQRELAPERRLLSAAIGGTVFAIGVYWLGWTGYNESIHWMAPTASGVFIGFGIICIFLQFINYLVDSYLNLAASVLAANTIFRSAVAASFPLFSRQLFENLGIQWGGTLLGTLALLMIPIPFLFMKYGAYLRGKSKYLS